MNVVWHRSQWKGFAIFVPSPPRGEGQGEGLPRAKFRALTLTLSRARERGQELRNFVTGYDTSGCALSGPSEV